jgi:hypothetical protein
VRRLKIAGVWPCVDDVDLQPMILVVMKARWARMNLVGESCQGLEMVMQKACKA